MSETILIAGLGSAGYAAMMAVKRANPKADIALIDPKEYDLAHPCGIPYALEGAVDPAGLTQDLHLSRMGVTKYRGRLARVETDRHISHIVTPGGNQEVKYAKLIITTGSLPFLPPIPGLADLRGKGVYTLADTADLSAISSAIAGGGKAIVIGAGAIGLEAAVALKERGYEVTVLEALTSLLPGALDPDMAAPLESMLAAQGIELLTGERVLSVEGDGHFTRVTTAERSIAGDILISAAGFKPNIDFAASSGLKHGPGGLIVDRFLSAGRDIFAAGDAVQAVSVIDGKAIGAKLATSAYKQGTAAGMNACGHELPYRGSAAAFVTKIGDVEAAGVGFTSEAARERGIKTAAGRIKSFVLPDYFPGNSDISIKVLIDTETRKPVGAQAVGTEGAAWRINIISTAIEFGITADDIGRVELAYCPAVSEVHDPLFKAIEFALRRIKR